MTTMVKPGDFFVCSWGYDETRVDFYKVISLTPSGKSVRVQRWSKRIIDDNGGPVVHAIPGESPTLVPCWDGGEQVAKVAPLEVRRLKNLGDLPWFTVNTYSVATLWDGRPQYQTGHGWGH